MITGNPSRFFLVVFRKNSPENVYFSGPFMGQVFDVSFEHQGISRVIDANYIFIIIC